MSAPGFFGVDLTTELPAEAPKLATKEDLADVFARLMRPEPLRPSIVSPAAYEELTRIFAGER